MKYTLKKYIFDKWWIPIIIFILISIIYISSLTSTNQILIRIIDNSLIASGILIIIAAIWQFLRGHNFLGVVQIGFLIFAFLGISFVTSFMMMFGPDTDVFADNLELPKNVELNYPIDLKIDDKIEGIRPDSFNQKKVDEIEFQLYNSFQPGLYEYDLWLNTQIDGTVYLKAFEITKNIQLSTAKLRDRSGLIIEATNNKVKRFSTNDTFTIYEGDWGKPYGARFEVWFIPKKGGKEFKIIEKNYVIEGWMR